MSFYCLDFEVERTCTCTPRITCMTCFYPKLISRPSAPANGPEGSRKRGYICTFCTAVFVPQQGNLRVVNVLTTCDLICFAKHYRFGVTIALSLKNY